MPTIIRVRDGVVRYENDERLSPEEREAWVNARGGRGGSTWGRTYAEVMGNPEILSGADRRRWVYMTPAKKPLLMANGAWNLSDVAMLIQRFGLQEGGVKNGKLWFQIEDPSPFLYKDSEGMLRLQGSPYYQWLPKEKQWLVTVPPEERAPALDVFEGKLALRCVYPRERIDEGREQFRQLRDSGAYEMVMVHDEPVVKFVAVFRDQAAEIARHAQREVVTVIRNGIAAEHALSILEISGRSFVHVPGKRKLSVNGEERWYDGVLVLVSNDRIWHPIVKEAPLRKTSDLEFCAQCPFWATFETDTGRDQRCAKGLLNNPIEAMRSLHCDDEVKSKDRGNQFRPFPTWVELTPQWSVTNSRETKLPLWIFSDGERGQRRVPQAQVTKRQPEVPLSRWAADHLDDELAYLAGSPTVASWVEARLTASDRSVLMSMGMEPRDWMAWLSQHGDHFEAPFVAPSVFRRAADLAGTDSLRILGPALDVMTADLSDAELLEILEARLEREVAPYNEQYGSEEEAD